MGKFWMEASRPAVSEGLVEKQTAQRWTGITTKLCQEIAGSSTYNYICTAALGAFLKALDGL